MVRALLDGRKSVTRRVVKPQPQNTDCEHEMITFNDMLPQFYSGDYTCVCRKCGYGVQPNGESVFRPPFRPGDILYVRETWARVGNEKAGRPMHYEYRVDCENPFYFSDGFMASWRPSIHMPKKAARLFLRVTSVRVERLQKITTQGIVNEGIVPKDTGSGPMRLRTRQDFYEAFEKTWDSTIRKADLPLYGWNANPWVWVIEFERCERPKESAFH